MTDQQINMIMSRLDDITDQMVIHQSRGDHDVVTLLDQEARELVTQLDEGEEIMTLPLV